MRAAILRGPGALAIEERPVPAPADDEVLVRVVATGVCGTDVESYRSGLDVSGPGGHAAHGGHVLGHEVIGVVATAARNGEGPVAGTVVVVDVVTGCGSCWWCERHLDGLCPNLLVRGQHVDGGMADYMLADAKRCVPVPDHVPLLAAVFAEPTAVAVRAVRKVGPMLGRTALVVGGGAIGQLVAQVAMASGARRVLLTDPVAGRRAVAETTRGVTACAPQDLRSYLAGLPVPGVDVAFECSGRTGMVAEALGHVRPGGTVVALGLRDGDEPVLVMTLVLGERTVVGSAAHLWDDDVQAGVDLMATGAIDPTRLPTEVVRLDDLEAVLRDGGGADVVKTVVHLGESS